MEMATETPPALLSQRPRYIEQPAPLVFPEAAEVPESQLHLDLRTLLYQLLQDELGSKFTVGSDQFVYFDAANPSACLAPDVTVGLMPAREKIRSWKVWERGAPAVAVEIVSDSDAPELPWQTKLQRYQRLGVTELLRFDPESEQQPLRVWDRVGEVLTERHVEGTVAPSLVLQLQWVVAAADDMPLALRIRKAGELTRTRLEARRADREALQAEREALQAEREARQAAEARVQELEAELQRRK